MTKPKSLTDAQSDTYPRGLTAHHELFPRLEDCAIAVCETYIENFELADAAMTFFMHCFFEHLPDEQQAKSMMLIIKNAAERCLHFGAD